MLYDGDPAGIHASMRGIDMLLAEGMNVKVLLLPDGDDPDSFARKHTAQEFRDYIEANQTDFIEFKTNLLLEGVTDPVERSQAISSIVKSVSVIDDQITRAAYVAECSHRLGVSEAVLVDTVNKYIRSGIDEQRKEERRRAHGAAGAGADEAATPAGAGMGALEPLPGVKAAPGVEYMLMQLVVRHGHEVVYRGVETDDGTVDLNVAQYVSYDLGADGLKFGNDLYNRMLAEAVEHSGDEGFNAESYFTRHPDVEVSRTATEMAIDHFKLSRSLQVRRDDDSLRNQAEHLVLDFRMEYVSRRMDEVRRGISTAAADAERTAQLMAEYKDLQAIRNAIAKELGNDIISPAR